MRRILDDHPWVLMAAIVLVSAIAAMLLVRFDQAADIQPDLNRVWLYGGTAESAISLLSAVASSAITVAGVVFSATFVTMQLASSQYTPRVVQALSRRWALHLVLGAFLGDFIYSLIVLRSIRPVGNGREEEFVPVIAVSISVIFSLVCVGVMIYYIAYGMRSLQPTFLIDSAARETIQLLENRNAIARTQREEGERSPIPTPDGPFQEILGNTPGFVQRVRFHVLLDVAEENDLVIRFDGRTGEYMLQQERLFTIWHKGSWSPHITEHVRKCVVLGPERTTDQDIDFGIRRVADILLKALSPAINDPTTAEYCLNRLCELLVMLADGPDPRPYVAGADGQLRVFWEKQSFASFVNTALGQIRFYIGHDVSLMLYTLNMLERTYRLIDDQASRIPLLVEAQRIRKNVLEVVNDEVDLARLTEAAMWIEVAS